MLNHLSIGVRDIARTKRFYDAALEPLGYTVLSASDTSLGYGKDAVVLWISPTDKPVPADDKSGLHFCFDAPTRKSVAAFHDREAFDRETDAARQRRAIGRAEQ